MPRFVPESFIVNGEITSVDLSSDVVSMAFSDGMTAKALYPALAQGGISSEVGERFSALADEVAPNMVISPYSFMAMGKLAGK